MQSSSVCTLSTPSLQDLHVWPNFPHLVHRSILFFEAMEGWVLVMSRQKMSWVFTLMDICRALHEVPDLHARINMFQDSPDSSEYWGMGSPLLSLNSSWEWAHIWWTLGLIIANVKDCLWWIISPYPKSSTFSGSTNLVESTCRVIRRTLNLESKTLKFSVRQIVYYWANGLSIFGTEEPAGEGTIVGVSATAGWAVKQHSSWWLNLLDDRRFALWLASVESLKSKGHQKELCSPLKISFILT